MPYLCGVFFGTQTFYLLISHTNCNLEKEKSNINTQMKYALIA